MWPWFGWNPRRGPISVRRMPYDYPWGAISKEEEVRMLEEQERWLTNELNDVKERVGELRK